MILSVDTESNTYNKGSPFDSRYKAVCYSWADESGSGADQISEDSLAVLADRINGSRILVGFNLKYDLHVLRKLGVYNGDYGGTIWDCQIGEFILSRQRERYPSLEEALQRHGLGHKLDVVKKEYWDKGIQTDEVPWPILSEYAEQDAVMTLKLYHRQCELLSPVQQRLVRLMGMDLLILEEMEWNGLTFNEEMCQQRSTEIAGEIQQITDQLSKVYPNVPINFNSGDQLSAFLYGGTIEEEVREHVGFFKTGLKIGQPRYRVHTVLHEIPRLVQPVKGSQLAKEGYYATNADTLLKLRPSRATKGIIELIQRQVRLHTLLSKSYDGLLKSNRDGYWEPGVLHGQFNQCVAQTGRLSSSAPNLQNIDSEALELFVSRYAD
jgi:DNA polymerase I-like protein with 3'-5' exonuclease and polymerase domains